jgi:hypothetical protein
MKKTRYEAPLAAMLVIFFPFLSTRCLQPLAHWPVMASVSPILSANFDRIKRSKLARIASYCHDFLQAVDVSGRHQGSQRRIYGVVHADWPLSDER